MRQGGDGPGLLPRALESILAPNSPTFTLKINFLFIHSAVGAK